MRIHIEIKGAELFLHGIKQQDKNEGSFVSCDAGILRC